MSVHSRHSTCLVGAGDGSTQAGQSPPQRVPSRPPVFLFAPAAAVLLSACGAQESDCPLYLTMRFNPASRIEQLLLSEPTAARASIAPVLVPDPPSPLHSGEETILLLLPANLDGRKLTLRVDGLAASAVHATGAVSTRLAVDSTTFADVLLGAASFCGDAHVRPLLEACDDGNLLADDGCDPSCQVEPHYRCQTRAPDGPSECTNAPGF